MDWNKFIETEEEYEPPAPKPGPKPMDWNKFIETSEEADPASLIQETESLNTPESLLESEETPSFINEAETDEPYKLKLPSETWQPAPAWSRSFIETASGDMPSFLEQAADQMSTLDARHYKFTEILYHMLFDIIFGEKGKKIADDWDKCTAQRDASGV